MSAITTTLPQPGVRIKIGTVAKHFKISVDLLRLYEREGLVIPLKSSKGTRYYTEQDYAWIATILRLVRDARLNFAGIRHLLVYRSGPACENLKALLVSSPAPAQN
jgi:DNA-binding transcriptional MerR regulator